MVLNNIHAKVGGYPSPIVSNLKQSSPKFHKDYYAELRRMKQSPEVIPEGKDLTEIFSQQEIEKVQLKLDELKGSKKTIKLARRCKQCDQIVIKKYSILRLIKSFKELKKIQLPYCASCQKTNFNLRINNCDDLPWGNIYCNTSDCFEKLTKKPIKLTCLSPYCNHKECIKNRVRTINFRLHEFGIKSKNLYHFSVGFKPLEKITNEDRIKMQKSFIYFMKLLNKSYEKEYGQKLYSICARDLNKSKRNNDFLRLHYHIATLPIKDQNNFRSMTQRCSKKTQEKFGLEINPTWIGYRKRNNVLEYFAKRIAGVFGHNRFEEKQFTYQDIMGEDEYFEGFYKTKALTFFNLQYRSREATSGFIKELNVVPKICPKCHIPTKNNIRFEEIILKKTKPPNPVEKASVVYEYY